MEHILWTELAKDGLHSGLTADRGDDDTHLNVGKIFRHHQTDVVLRRFRLIDQHHGVWTARGYLTDHL